MYPGCVPIPHTGQPTQLTTDTNPNSQRSHEETYDGFTLGIWRGWKTRNVSPRQVEK
jgi:hypothetical protein